MVSPDRLRAAEIRRKSEYQVIRQQAAGRLTADIRGTGYQEKMNEGEETNVERSTLNIEHRT